MPRHSNSYACGMDIPEVAFDKRCRRSSHRPMGGTKVQKHPGKQSLDLESGVHLSSIDEHEFWYESEHDPEVSDETTASPEPEEEDDFDESGWDFVSPESAEEEKKEEWPALQGKNLQAAMDALETMSMASDLTLCSWVDVADVEDAAAPTEAEAPTWAARLGTSTAPRPPKATLPWAHRRPRVRVTHTPEGCDVEDAADVAGRSWNKWQKSSRNTKAMQKTAEKIHRRLEQSRRAKGDEL
ncbi:unnamed protein product [Symbiodinium natans]|uniref:Uncharacterized protein n=1 Tax=Symbiodinium natans TaxID=878477 RepID=A0A812MW75_9DINO|nr:unnamed protein product [Symbiodinium natans]